MKKSQLEKYLENYKAEYKKTTGRSLDEDLKEKPTRTQISEIYQQMKERAEKSKK